MPAFPEPYFLNCTVRQIFKSCTKFTSSLRILSGVAPQSSTFIYEIVVGILNMQNKEPAPKKAHRLHND